MLNYIYLVDTKVSSHITLYRMDIWTVSGSIVVQSKDVQLKENQLIPLPLFGTNQLINFLRR